MGPKSCVQCEQEVAQHTALEARAECSCGGCVGPHPHCLLLVHQKAPNPIAGEGWEVKI